VTIETYNSLLITHAIPFGREAITADYMKYSREAWSEHKPEKKRYILLKNGEKYPAHCKRSLFFLNLCIIPSRPTTHRRVGFAGLMYVSNLFGWYQEENSNKHPVFLLTNASLCLQKSLIEQYFFHLLNVRSAIKIQS